MKKTLTIILLILSIIMILDSLNAGHALVMFFLAGVIPGTNITIGASQMLETFTFLIGFTLSRITLNLMRLSAQYRSEERTSSRISRARA